MKPYIQTVSGRIPPDSIEFCHCHEHLFICEGKSCKVNPALRIDDYGKTLSEVRDFMAAGGTSIVDAQPIGCGRMADKLLSLSLDCGVQIIASTGFHKMIFYPEEHWIFYLDQDKLTGLFLHEILSGMYVKSDTELSQYTDARAGIIKCALDTHGLDPQYRKLFSAAAEASKLTAVPLMVHIEKGSDPIGLANYLEQKNINLNRVIFCHMDRACHDTGIHKELCARGICLEYDTIARPKYHSDERETELFVSLIQAGYENRLLFSLDTTRERLKSYTPDGAGLTYLIRTFMPLLHAYGVTGRQLQKISRDNCRRILTITPPYSQ